MSDIAVIEIEDSHGWNFLAYIGPDRSGGDLWEYEGAPEGARIRIRYLDRDEDQDA